MSIGDLPESLSRAMLVGTMLVGRLGVLPCYYYISIISVVIIIISSSSIIIQQQ